MNLPARPASRCAHEIEDAYAREYGLDFYEVVFELLDYDQLNEVAAYGGFPTRYPHWRFGMEYEELTKSYSYGLSKIYELVINNNPVYAYLHEGERARGAEAGHGPRLRPRRLLQEQPLVQQDQPPHDRRDGEPRHARAPPHRPPRRRERSRTSSTPASASRT